MRHSTSIRFGLARLLAAVALAAAVPALVAQEGLEPFAALHQRLDSAADRLLSGPQNPENVPAEPLNESGKEEAGIEQFAQEHWNGRAEDLRKALGRVQALRPALEATLREEGVPTELVAVVLVESAGHTTALSPQGARGLWQFMPATARRYNLTVNPRADDRLNVEKSSRAAARHLRDLHELFGDWRLALAAYNAGAGAVKHAVRRGGSKDFAILSSLRLLPAETRGYVPAVLGAARLLGGAEIRPAGPERVSGHGIVYATPTRTEDASGEARD